MAGSLPPPSAFCHKTIYYRIQKYIALMEKYIDKITPRLSDVWRADEMYTMIPANSKISPGSCFLSKSSVEAKRESPSPTSSSESALTLIQGGGCIGEMLLTFISSATLNPFVRKRCLRSPELESRFKEFNAKYFGSRLPSYRVLLCSKPKNFGHEFAGFCDDERREICIRGGLSEGATLQTLVHEMAHAKLNGVTEDLHGRTFVRELRRLRRMGAPLSAADVDLVPPYKSSANRRGGREDD